MSLLSLYILCENCIYALHNHIVCKAIIAINPKIVSILMCLPFMFIFLQR